MSKKAVLAAAFSLLAVLIVFAGPTTPAPEDPIYGFGVRVLPDEEFDDFVQCRLSVFRLDTEEEVAELPSLRIMAGDVNAMVLRTVDDLEVTFECTVNAEKTEATYAVAGTRSGRLLMNQLATIRLQ